MTFDPSVEPNAFAGRGPISAQELRELRAQVWADGSVSAEEADKLFAMNRSVEPSSEWTDFFIEAICEFMLSQGEPRGYVTEDEAGWLLRKVNHGGRIDTHAELELIVKLLERAEYAPPSLRRFALGTIEQTVLTGVGPTRQEKDAGAARIGDAEAGMIRRLIFAPAGDGQAKVSSAEAELLFRLKDATVGHENSREWKKLFVQGVANHLLAQQNYSVTSPSEQSRLDGPFEGQPLRDATSAFGHLAASADEFLGERQHERRDEFNEDVVTEGEGDLAETDWQKRLSDKGRQMDEYERALLDFLAEEGLRPF